MYGTSWCTTICSPDMAALIMVNTASGIFGQEGEIMRLIFAQELMGYKLMCVWVCVRSE